MPKNRAKISDSNIISWKPLTGAQVHACGTVLHAPGAGFGPYRDTTYEFVWILEGEVRANYGGQMIQCSAGTVLLSVPGMTYSYCGDSRQRTVHFYLMFSVQPNPPIGWPLAAQFPRVRNYSGESLLHCLFRSIMSLQNLDVRSTSGLVTATLELMLRAFITGQDSLAPVPVIMVPKPVQRAMRVITHHAMTQPREPLTLDGLAKKSLVSRQHLCRLFRSTVGAGPLEYDRQLRLEQSALLLAQTTFGIKEIAYKTGFSNPFHFSRVFKQLYTIPPATYRKRFGEGDQRIPNPMTRIITGGKMSKRLLNSIVE